jgi:hypothetical protein
VGTPVFARVKGAKFRYTTLILLAFDVQTCPHRPCASDADLEAAISKGDKGMRKIVQAELDAA